MKAQSSIRFESPFSSHSSRTDFLVKRSFLSFGYIHFMRVHIWKIVDQVVCIVGKKSIVVGTVEHVKCTCTTQVKWPSKCKSISVEVPKKRTFTQNRGCKLLVKRNKSENKKKTKTLTKQYKSSKANKKVRLLQSRETEQQANPNQSEPSKASHANRQVNVAG